MMSQRVKGYFCFHSEELSASELSSKSIMLSLGTGRALEVVKFGVGECLDAELPS